MKRAFFPIVAAGAAAAAFLVPAAEAKFGLSVKLEPARPTAQTATRVVVRTDVDLRRSHGIRLFAVGPWRNDIGQAFLEIRLTWRGPRLLTGRVRFPYAGRWHLNVPPSRASHPVDVWVTVRPRA